MAYVLQSLTIRTNNSNEGMQKIDAIWQDIASGKLPILFDSDHAFQQGISAVSKYSAYAGDEAGDYDLSILGVRADFFRQLENEVSAGRYKKYIETGDNLAHCAKTAWQMVWDEQKSGVIQRAYTEDYESTVPAEYTKDGKCHCYLYIAVH